MIELIGSRVTLEGYQVQTMSVGPNPANGRNNHYAIYAQSGSSVTARGVILRNCQSQVGATFAAFHSDTASRILYDTFAKPQSGTVYEVAPFSGGQPYVLPLVPVPSTWYRVGLYYFVPGNGSPSTSNTLGNGTLRLVPFVVPRAMTMDRVGAEITAAGDAGSTFRIAMYSDLGPGFNAGYPGNLFADLGSIAADTIGVKEITTNKIIPPGLYWIGGAVQGVTVTQPTVRTVAGAAAIQIGIAGTPGAGDSRAAWSMTGVTDIPPSSFSSGNSSAIAAPRIFIRTA